jgi:capsular polysaccharide transport system permease protein
MRLRGLTRALIFVRGDNPVPAPRRADTLIVGTGTRLVPTVYDAMRRRRRRRLMTMALCVGLPTVIAGLYYAFIANDRYVSETQMILSADSVSGGGGAGGGGLASPGKSASSGSSASSLLSLVGVSGGGDDPNTDQEMVQNYLQSTEAMLAADRAIGLRKMWSASSIDFFSRLSPDASAESFLRYYQRHVTVSSDPLDPVVDVQVQSFSPADAQLIAKTLVRLGQEKLNAAYRQMRDDSLNFARSEVARAEQRLTAVNDKIRVFRNLHGDIDPTATIGVVGSVAGTTFGELSTAKAQLETALSYARPDSPMVKGLQAYIDALEKQMQSDRGLLAGPQANQNYANLLGQYEDLMLDQQFAEAIYTSALSLLNSARAATMHQHTYLIDFIKPSLPEASIEPQAVRNVMLVFFASFLAYLIGSLVTSALREHAHP